MGYRFLDPNPQFCDSNGDPLASGTVTFYQPGTLTLKNVYTTSALSVATDNPMPLNSAGRTQSEVFLSGDYRVILKDSSGATVWDRDPVSQLLTAGEVQNNSFINCAVGGTADVITLTPTPAITAYADGQVFEFVATGTNTTNVTANVSGLGAKAVTKDGTTALVAGDIVNGQAVRLRYDGTRLQLTSPNAHALKSTVVGVAYLGVNQSFTKAQGVNRSALTDAATIAVDASLSNVFTVTLGGNRTLGQPTNPKDGQSITIFITQDGTGSRTLAYHADWLFPGGADPVLSTAAGSVDVLSGVYNGGTTKWYASLSRAFA